jgi:hypothetical protein
MQKSGPDANMAFDSAALRSCAHEPCAQSWLSGSTTRDANNGQFGTHVSPIVQAASVAALYPSTAWLERGSPPPKIVVVNLLSVSLRI